MAGETVEIRRYVVPATHADEFERMLQVHWRALRIYRLVTDERPLVYRSVSNSEMMFVEIFSWLEPSKAQQASAIPAIRSVVDPMKELCRAVDGGCYERLSMSALADLNEGKSNE